MIDFLIYDAKVAVLIAVFYMFYRLLLSRETFHRVNRIVLMLTAVASFFLPFCVITMHETVTMPMPEMHVEMGPLMAEVETPSVPLWQTLLPILFIIGMCATLGHTLLSMIRIILLIRKSEQHPQPDGVTVCVTGNAALSPFSWMHYIVMNREDYETHDSAILAHERGHIRLHHSWDLILVDTLTALQWFNPAMWMLRSDLRAIHEYEADAAVLSQGINARQYQYLLITKAAGIGGYSLANGISHSTLKNRINMMLHTKSPRQRYLKLLALLPIVAVALAVNAEKVTDVVYTNNHSSVVTAEAIGNAKTASATPESNVLSFRVVFMPEGAPVEGVPVEVIVNGKVTQRLETTEGGNISLNAPTGSVVRFTVIDKTKEVKVTNDLLANAANRTITIGFGDTDQTIISEGETFMAEGTVYDYDEEKPTPVIGAVVKNVRTQKSVVTDKEGRFSIEATAGDQVVVSYAGYEPFALGVSKVFSDNGSKYIVPLRHVNTGKTFDVVEEMPQFPGGPAALFEFLSKNIQYPKDAEKAKLQGRVIVTFVVKKDGSITDAKVVKSVAPSLDAEALRVINAMPNWAPGRQGGQPVNVKYTVPLTFRLNGNDNKEVAQISNAGSNALSGGETFFVIDDKPATAEEVKQIDPKTIDHMDVLKGESATKLYGEKAKHGAVLIFTKKNQ
ncbi:MAG: TonB family protein [Prevotella sp.]|nr:TonB family protein [Prevotella sp.]